MQLRTRSYLCLDKRPWMMQCFHSCPLDLTWCAKSLLSYFRLAMQCLSSIYLCSHFLIQRFSSFRQFIKSAFQITFVLNKSDHFFVEIAALCLFLKDTSSLFASLRARNIYLHYTLQFAGLPCQLRSEPPNFPLFLFSISALSHAI